MSAFLVVDPNDDFHICYTASTAEEAERLATDGLVVYAPLFASGLVPDVDDLSNFIRGIDGSNKMSAGALAERICDWLASPSTKEAQE
jgi:hypothetical protein